MAIVPCDQVPGEVALSGLPETGEHRRGTCVTMRHTRQGAILRETCSTACRVSVQRCRRLLRFVCGIPKWMRLDQAAHMTSIVWSAHVSSVVRLHM
jgi:hypothetical protein